MIYNRRKLLPFLFSALLISPPIFAKDASKPEAWDKLKLETANKEYSIEFGGKLMLDYAAYDDDLNDFADGSEIRRARIAIEGDIAEYIKYKVQYEFSPDNHEFKDVWIGYSITDSIFIKAGKFEQPNSLENTTSSSNIIFMERSLPVMAFSSGKTKGINISANGENWSASSGIFEYNDDPDAIITNDNSPSFSGRVTIAPVNQKKNALHIGLWGQYISPITETYEVEVDPEVTINSEKLMDTGHIDDIDNVVTGGIEGVLIYGPASIQGEYITATINRQNSLNGIKCNGFYISASYFITGESRPYKASEGSIKKIKPKKTHGAWEIAARSSFIDLDDQNLQKGKEENYTLGLNWYVNPNIRFMLNYVKIDTDNDTRSSDVSATQVRGQITF